MSKRPRRRLPDRLETEFVLEVIRFEANERRTVRTLSRVYGGCFVHWFKGRNRYCPGAEHCEHHGRIDAVWKGYAAVEEWQDANKLWYPGVLEITEGLELDFRGRYERGQVWELHRWPKVGKDNSTPLRGKLVEELNPDHVPAPFDFRAVLLHLYHVREIVLDQDNPLPPRLLVRPSTGHGPGEKPQPVAQAANGKTVKQILEERLRGIGQPAEVHEPGKNGIGGVR